MGAAYFITSSVSDLWVPPYQVGAAVWIGGCIAYLLPLVVHLRKGASGLSPWLQAFCMLAFMAGCVVSLFGSTDAEIRPLLPTINGCFTAGSVLLLIDAGVSWLSR